MFISARSVSEAMPDVRINWKRQRLPNYVLKSCVDRRWRCLFHTFSHTLRKDTNASEWWYLLDWFVTQTLFWTRITSHMIQSKANIVKHMSIGNFRFPFISIFCSVSIRKTVWGSFLQPVSSNNLGPYLANIISVRTFGGFGPVVWHYAEREITHKQRQGPSAFEPLGCFQDEINQLIEQQVSNFTFIYNWTHPKQAQDNKMNSLQQTFSTARSRH